MITNIEDRRTNVHLWKSIDIVIEATSHDNLRDNPTPHDNTDTEGESCFYRTKISVADAVRLAHSVRDEVTLYLYDLGQFGKNIDY